MVIEISSDSSEWLSVKHALREAGYKSFLQPILFDNTRANLFLERRSEDPEGKLVHGFIVHDGGVRTHIQLVNDGEYAEPLQAMPVVLQDRPAAKSSTSVL